MGRAEPREEHHVDPKPDRHRDQFVRVLEATDHRESRIGHRAEEAASRPTRQFAGEPVRIHEPVHARTSLPDSWANQSTLRVKYIRAARTTNSAVVPASSAKFSMRSTM